MESKDHKKFKTLFLCTGNSARSIFAEYILRRLDPHKFESYSAGSEPKGEVNPVALRVLQEDHKIDASDARSKDWDEYKGIQFDFVITVCDRAKQTCPVWPGQPIVAHWSAPDPVEATGTEEDIRRVFRDVSMLIRRRLELFSCLPFEKLDRYRLEFLTKDIGTKKGQELEDAVEEQKKSNPDT